MQNINSSLWKLGINTTLFETDCKIITNFSEPNSSSYVDDAAGYAAMHASEAEGNGW
jgi:hypothetical protein